MNVTICTIGELLVEFLAEEENQGSSRPSEFWGPYPNGAPAISTDQVARLGFGSMLFNCADNDIFGEMNIARLEKDGVNINGIIMLQKVATGSAFISYRSQAQHDSILNAPNNACGLLTADHIDETLLNQCQHFHIMESSLFSFRVIDAMRETIENIKGRNGMASFDPNIRKEMPNIPEMPQAFGHILDYIGVLLPSDGELDCFGLNPERSRRTLVDDLLKRSVKRVVIKRGLRGASYFSANETHRVVGFNMPVMDPTGAGDCSGTVFISLFLNGAMPQEAPRRTNASGSLAVSQRGPMEGTSMRAQIHAFPTVQHP